MKLTTSLGSTGMTMPSASMSSRTVTKMKANPAWRRVRPGALGSGFAAGVWIGLLPQGQADRRAGQVECLAQAVHQIALVRRGNRVGTGAEHDEARRARLHLGDVVEPDAATRHRRRRMLRQRLLEPTVELIGGDAAVPHRVDV